MQTSVQKIFLGSIFFLLTSFIAVIGYWLAGWELLDAIYMVVITIYGVGYGEVQPVEHPVLKIFTMVVIIAGCSSAIYVIGGFVQMLAEGEINRVLEVRRMTKGIDKLTDHAIICGYGRVGQILARDLKQVNHPFVVIDSNADRLREAESQGFWVILGNASEEEILEAAGIQRARSLATVLPDDAMNVFITLTARDLNESLKIYARGQHPSTEKKLIRSGANHIVLPAAIGASKIASMITCPSAETLLSEDEHKIRLNEELRMIGLKVTEVPITKDSSLIGEQLQEVEVEAKGGFVIIAVVRADQSVLSHPPLDTVLEVEDRIVILGHEEHLPKISQKASRASKRTTWRGATLDTKKKKGLKDL
ncbi:Voltage-gated potassium channel Kch [Planctomycetales bacterium 10988]|nr:Voltage-gated potassium channel Kch [Planctomycetales bacterium 10988]